MTRRAQVDDTRRRCSLERGRKEAGQEEVPDVIGRKLHLPARIGAHERDCFETRQEIKASMVRLHQRLDKIVWAILAVLAMVAWSLLREKMGL